MQTNPHPNPHPSRNPRPNPNPKPTLTLIPTQVREHEERGFLLPVSYVLLLLNNLLLTTYRYESMKSEASKLGRKHQSDVAQLDERFQNKMGGVAQVRI